MVIVVYRYGHRKARDKRVTTHLALVARAFGANKIFIDEKDANLEKVIEEVKQRFGNDFEIRTGVNWKKFFKEWDGIIVHLTMYGEKFTDVMEEIKKHDKVMVVVGSQKVPGEFYQMANFNVSIGNQPHSEISALAIFLHYMTEGKWMDKEFFGKYKIIPQKKGKKIVENDYVELLKKEGCSPEVIEHSLKVQKLALKIAEKIKENGVDIDMNVVSLGALFHDIGRAKTHGIMHIVEGVKIGKRLNLPEKVILAIERHAGAGIDEEEAKKLGLPPKDYTPKTIEEEIVAHADNLTGNGYKNIEEVVRDFERKIGKKAAKKVLDLHKKLSNLCGINIEEL